MENVNLRAIDTLHELYPTGGLTPERDAEASAIVRKHLTAAWDAGQRASQQAVGVDWRWLYASVGMLIVSLVASGYLAATRQPVRTVAAPTAVPLLLDGAPDWEASLMFMQPADTDKDPMLLDFRARLTDTDVAVGDIQYRNLLFIRIVRPDQSVRILVYRWQTGAWSFYGEQCFPEKCK